MHSSQPHYLDNFVPVWLSEVACEGSERTLTDCPNLGWGAASCQHSLDAGVTCEPPRYPIRLSGGDTSYEGTVEVGTLTQLTQLTQKSPIGVCQWDVGAGV